MHFYISANERFEVAMAGQRKFRSFWPHESMQGMTAPALDQRWHTYVGNLCGNSTDDAIAHDRWALNCIGREAADVPKDRAIVRQFVQDNPSASLTVIVQVLRAAIASRPTPPKSAA
jgi:hypothetical protein